MRMQIRRGETDEQDVTANIRSLISRVCLYTGSLHSAASAHTRAASTLSAVHTRLAPTRLAGFASPFS